MLYYWRTISGNLKPFQTITGDGAIALCLKFTLKSKLSRIIGFTISNKKKFRVTDVTPFVTEVTFYEI